MLLHNSVIVDVVPSLFDGKPVLVLATGFRGGTNKKLGLDVISVYYIREDVYPFEAVKNEEDYSVCANCPLRPSKNAVCYVGIYSVDQMFSAYKRGTYPKLSPAHIKYISTYKKVLRLGSYGDPTCVPLSTVKPLIDAAGQTLGYTHQWRSHLSDPYRPYLMASVDSPLEAAEAELNGWKYYRIKKSTDKVQLSEVPCPWIPSNKKTQCMDCRLCDGQKVNVVVDVSKMKAARFEKFEEK